MAEAEAARHERPCYNISGWKRVREAVWRVVVTSRGAERPRGPPRPGEGAGRVWGLEGRGKGANQQVSYRQTEFLLSSMSEGVGLHWSGVEVVVSQPLDPSSREVTTANGLGSLGRKDGTGDPDRYMREDKLPRKATKSSQ